MIETSPKPFEDGQMTRNNRRRRARNALLALLAAHFAATTPASWSGLSHSGGSYAWGQDVGPVPWRDPARGQTIARVSATQPAPQVDSVLNTIQMPAAFVSKVSTSLELRYRDMPGVQISPDARDGRLVILAPPAMQKQIQAEAMQIYVAESKPGASQAGVSPALATSLPGTVNNGVRTTGGQLQVQLSSIDWRTFEDSLHRVAGKRVPVTTSQNGQKAMFQLTGAPLDGTVIEVNRVENVVTVVAPEPAMPGWQKMIRSLDSSATRPGDVVELVRVENAKPAPIQRALRLIDGLPADATATVVPSRSAAAFRTTAMQEPGAAVAPAAQPAQPPAPRLPGLAGPGVDVPGADQPVVVEAAPGEESAGIIGDTQIQFVPELGIIIVRGAKRDTQRVLDVIKQIEEQSAVTQPEVEVYPLKNLNSSALAELLTEVYDEVLAARQGEVDIRALDQPNALLLVGRREAVASAIMLIEKLDQPLDQASRLRVFPLKYASATDAEVTVRGFFVEKPGSEEDNRPGLGSRVRIIADFRTNSLIVGASPRDLDEVAGLLRSLDVENVPATNEIRVFPLRNSLAADLAPVIQGAINGEGEGTAATGDATNTRPSTSLSILAVDSAEGEMLSSGILSGLVVTADANANALIVRGPSSSMSLVSELIRQLDQVPGVEASVKVFTIENGDASRLVTALQQLFSSTTQGQTGGGFGGGGGATGGAANLGALTPATASNSSLVNIRFSTDQRTNSIIATGTETDLEVVESILLRLDTKGFAERITEVIWLRHQTAPEIAAAIQQYVQQRVQTVNQIQQFQQGLGPFDLPDRDLVVVAEEVSNSLLLSVSPRLYQDVRKLIESLDRRPPMVLIKVVLAEVALSDTFELGGELGLQDSLLFDRSVATVPPIPDVPANSGFNFNQNGTANSGAINPDNIGSRALTTFGMGAASGATGYGGFVLSAASDSFSLLLRAMQDANRAQILSRPQIMTVDNKAGFVQVGQRVARVVGLQQGSVNFAPLLEIEDIDIGLILEVLPRVGADGLISMQIRAERSSIDDTNTGTPIGTDGDGNPIIIPNINSTNAESTIVAYSGQTVVFGGLIQKERVNVSRRVPWLSNIPLLGVFFRFDRESEERRELLVIMTPMLVNGDEDLEYIKRVESSRMSYCLADVVEMHGDVGLSEGYGLWGPAVGPTIYPDLQPTVDQFPRLNPGETIIGERVIGETITGERVIGERVIGESIMGDQLYGSPVESTPGMIINPPQSQNGTLPGGSVPGVQGQQLPAPPMPIPNPPTPLPPQPGTAQGQYAPPRANNPDGSPRFNPPQNASAQGTRVIPASGPTAY